MKKHIAPLGLALICAAVIHLLAIRLLDGGNWFDIEGLNEASANFEVSLIPAEQTPSGTESPTPMALEKDQDANGLIEQDDLFDLSFTPNQDNDLPDNKTSQPGSTDSQTSSSSGARTDAVANVQSNNEGADHIDISKLKKPDLLDLSKISLSPTSTNDDLKGVFSPSLQAKIEASKAAQRDYLKGQIKETDYPITKDADGTRYVNIKGVCWRMPKEGSNEGWVIVFAGCNGQTQSFHFELNITPSTLLGPNSPFAIGK